MIFKWIDHPSYHKDEQMMAILYDSSMATKRHLMVLTGWPLLSIQSCFQKIRARGHTKEEKNEWLRSYRIPNRREMAYALGKKGIRYVQDMMDERQHVREAPEAQITHFMGINDILIRIIESGVSKDDILWLSSAEATDLILRKWERRGKEMDKRHLIRPDARLGIRDRRYWIEYDNDTEGARKLERKFHGYVQLSDPDPVIWVAPNKKRRDYLQNLWRNTVRAFYSDSDYPIPKMHFFVAGEETPFLTQEAQAVPV